MPFKIVRNDITKMCVDAIVNTANEAAMYGEGVDTAVYHAAGEKDLLEARKKIGFMKEGEVVITPGFKLPAKYIIHAVSPCYIDGTFGEEQLLRGCYSKCLQLAYENKCKSIAFPLISTGCFGYPKEEGMRIFFIPLPSLCQQFYFPPIDFTCLLHSFAKQRTTKQRTVFCYD